MPRHSGNWYERGVPFTDQTTITTSDLGDDCITSSQIATDAVIADGIAAGAVGSAEIDTDAVGAAEIATDAVGAAEIAAGAVGTAEIATSAVTSTKIGTDEVLSSKLESALESRIPGNVTISLSSHSSDDEYDCSIALFDAGGNAWARPQHLRVYLSTGGASFDVATSAAARINIKSSASTDVFSSKSTINSGYAGTTHQTGLDLSFVTLANGTLGLNIEFSTDNAATHGVVVDWIGGVVASSVNIGTTLASSG